MPKVKHIPESTTVVPEKFIVELSRPELELLAALWGKLSITDCLSEAGFDPGTSYTELSDAVGGHLRPRFTFSLEDRNIGVRRV